MNILIIQLLRMGDSFQALPVIDGLRQFHPEANIAVLTSRLGAPIFSSLSEVDQVFELDKEKIVELVSTSRREDVLSSVNVIAHDLTPVLEQQWDWVINFSYSFSSALLCFLMDARYISGFHAIQNRQYIAQEKSFALSISSFVNRKFSVFNWVDINKYIVNLPSHLVAHKFPVEEGLLAHVDTCIAQAGFNGKTLIGINPGASGAYKQWPIDKFVDLAVRLKRNYDYRVIIFGDEHEAEMSNRIREALGNDCLNIAGKTSIPMLAAYLSRCKLLVSNDTGPAHVAAAVGTPVVGLFFSTHFVETGPYGAGHIAIYPNIDCFPCQATASCPHNKCTGYISPVTVEKIVRNYSNLVIYEDSIHINEDEGPVSVAMSFLDPLGTMDWRPIDCRPPTAQDVVRIAYRALWLGTFNDINETDELLTDYLDSLTGAFGRNDSGNSQTQTELTCLAQLHKGLTELAAHYEDARQLAIKFHQVLSQQDLQEVKQIGSALGVKEKAIAAIGENTWLNPLVEFGTIQRDNFFDMDLGRLAIKTMGLHEECYHLASRLKSHLIQVAMRLFPLEHFAHAEAKALNSDNIGRNPMIVSSDT